MSYRRLLDVFKMFMIQNVYKTDIWKTSARRLETADAFQIKRSLTDILQMYMCYLGSIRPRLPLLKKQTKPIAHDRNVNIIEMTENEPEGW